MAVESEEILSKISDLIESKVDELTTNLNNFRQEASNNNQTLENAIGSIKSVIDEKLSKIDEISSEINSIQTSVQSVADTVSATNNKIDNILSQQTQLQRTVDSVSQNIEKLSTVTSNQLTYLSNQSQNITEKVDKLSLQQEREARTAAVEGARGTVVVDSATGKTVSGVAAAGAGEETKQSLIGSVLSGIKGILTSPLALGGAALGAAALGTAAALRKEPPGTPQAGSDAEFNLPRDTSEDRRTGGQRESGPQPTIKKGMVTLDELKRDLETTSREYSPIPPKVGPASIRYNNPGAAWDRSRDKLFGLQGYGILVDPRTGERNRIGRYSNPTLGLASNMDLISTSKRYVNRTLQQATNTWRGRYSPAPKFKLSDGTEIGPNTILTPELLKNKEFMNKLFRKFAGHESGRKGTLSDEQISQAFDIYRAGSLKNYIKKVEKGEIPQQAPQPDARREPPQQAPQPDSGRELSQEQGRQFPTQRELYGVDEEVTSRFNELQGFVGPLKVISGYRSPSYNRRVGGAKKSQHTSGNAIDIDVRHLSIEQRQELIKNASALGYKGIGVYANSIHLDMGSRRYWGPNYSGNSLPGWARRVMRSHMSGRFNRDDLPKQQRERQRQPDAKTQPDPDVSQPGTDKAPVVTTGDILRSLIPGVSQAKASQYESVFRNESVFRDEEDQFMRTYYPSDADPKQYRGMDDADYEPDKPDLTGVPDFLKGFYKATSMPEGEDIEGRIEKKQPLLNFRGILREPSALGRMLGYERYVDEKRMKELMEQSKMLQSMDDADLTPPKTKSEMEKYLDDILKRARNVEEEAKKQQQQAPSQIRPVAGSLAGANFYKDEFPPGENKSGNGVNEAPRPKHKIKPYLYDFNT